MQKLKAIRLARKVTQEFCAKALGIPLHRWRRYENLQNDPGPEMRLRIADLLGTSLDQLAGRETTQAAS